MKRYFVVGFLFSEKKDRVLLIHKNRPDWQKGKLNGIGGKIEHGETPRQAIAREAMEECGCDLSVESWKDVTLMTSHAGDIRVHVFAAQYNGHESAVHQRTDEMIEWFDTMRLPETCIENLHWLIPLAIDRLTNDRLLSVHIKEKPRYE